MQALANGRHDDRSHLTGDGSRGIQGAQHVLGRGTVLLVERELELLAVAEESMGGPSKSDPIGLEAMPQARLRDATSELECAGQRRHLGEQVAVEVR